MANTTVSEIASDVEKVVTTAHQVVPIIEEVLALYPGLGTAAIVIKVIDSFYMPLISALDYLKQANGGDIVLAQTQLMAHLNPNLPNNSLLQGNK
jgi:hypothetical protein